MDKGFWSKFKKPIIGLAPMDGVTDAPFRLITAKYGKPDLLITEFTPVEGICAGAVKTLTAFRYDKSERPIIAQLFGCTPKAFYKAVLAVCELGFDGIDINMGCPAKNVASRGSGAALIQTPALAQEIILQAKLAVKDWANGKKLIDSDLPESIIEWVNKNRKTEPGKLKRNILPVSVKTRIGYNSVIIEEWVKQLLEVKPANISIHGRTLKQMYTGEANWEAIGRAAKIINKTETTVLGNGDIKDMAEAFEKIEQYSIDGVLIGRSAFGNPWIFQNQIPTLSEKLRVAVEHSKLYEKIFGSDHFVPMRKHLSWYCRGFANASEIRQKLMLAKNAADVSAILNFRV